MSTISVYECISNYAIIKSKSSLFSSTLGSLKRGSQIEVISINGAWAYFKYNNKNAYILTMFIKEVREVVNGSVTIRYLNKETNTEISPSVTNNNLTLNSYTYIAPYIEKYTVVEPSTKLVTLTELNPNQEIIFYYQENIIYGSVTINYINKENNEYISESKIYKNLKLGSYSYNAIEISGCELLGDSNKSVILTEDNSNQSITFEYLVEKIVEPIEPPEQLEPLEPFNQNEVPYISTYYIKPIVKPNEEVIIDYYITDYYHKEYVNEDYSEVFKVTVKVEGKDDIIVRNLKAGDHSISLGTFPNLDGQEQKFSILCTDKYGRNSHELFNFFLVRSDVPVKEYVMTTNDLINYNISNTNDTTKLTSTREGLQKLLDDKQTQGYNRLRLLAGTYRIDHLAPIYIPTKFTLDMNGATLKLHEFTGDKALMIELNNTFDSHVINGTIEGDFYNHDYKNSPNNSEWVHGVSIGGEAKYSSYEKLLIKDITGYGGSNGISNSKDNKLGYTHFYPRNIGNTFKLGDIDRNTGLDITSTNRTTCDFRDISGYDDIGYLSVSVYLGYQGNPCGTWNLICHFYDDNKKYIKSIDAHQYRRIAVPPNAKFMRVTILNEAYPTNLSIQLFRLPTHCSFKNIKFENCRCVGLAQSAMKDMLVEDCEFVKCGQNSAKCAYDAEDGWDMMQDVTFRKLNFHDNYYNDFLTCAGHNFIVENMISGKLYIWSRTKDLVIRNSNLSDTYLGFDSLVKTGCYRFYNNKSTSVTCREKATASDIILRDSEMASFTKATAYNCKITNGILLDGIVYNSQFINHNSNINTNVYIYNSNFITSDGQVTNLRLNQAGGIRVFDNCIFKGTTKILGNGCNSGLFTNCTFDDFDITINKPNKLDDLKFANCSITYYEKNVSGVDSGFVKLINANASCVFSDCKISCIPDDKNTKKPLVWIRGYVNGSKTIFKNCEISKSIGYVIDGYFQASTLASDTDYEVVLENSPINVQLISDKYKNYAYYKVNKIN